MVARTRLTVASYVHCLSYNNINSQLDATIIILLIVSISTTCFGWKYRPKHVELIEVNDKIIIVASSWLFILLYQWCMVTVLFITRSRRFARLSRLKLGPVYSELRQLQHETNHTHQMVLSSRSNPLLPSYSDLTDYGHTEQEWSLRYLFGTFRFNSRPRHWLHYLKFCWIFSFYQQMISYCLTLNQDRFLSIPFQFMIQCQSFDTVLSDLLTVVKSICKY